MSCLDGPLVVALVGGARRLSAGSGTAYRGDFTWELYFKLNAYPGKTMTVIGNTGRSLAPAYLTNPVGINLDLDEAGRLHVHIGLQEIQPVRGVIPMALPTGSWMHIALVMDRQAACSATQTLPGTCLHASLFLNRVRNLDWRIPEVNVSSMDLLYSGAAEQLFIGGDGRVGGVDRAVARVRVYKRTLTPVEMGTCLYEFTNPFRLVFNADLNGDLKELGSGSSIATGTGTLARFDWDAPPECMQSAENHYFHDLSRAVPYDGICGNGFREAWENCDDNNTRPRDGCSRFCMVEPGWVCRGGTPAKPDVCKPVICGDGRVEASEECDDKNTVPGDGCSSDCIVEPGYVCPHSVQPSRCATVCGDGLRAGREKCDDENSAAGDGCAANCTVEPGWTCVGGTPYRRDFCHTLCGDGIRIGLEECDDGNRYSGDGCSSRCKVEKNFVCEGGEYQFDTDTCRRTVCGDGVREGDEECDDHNLYSDDGCSKFCAWEKEDPSTSSEVSISIDVYRMPQACRIQNTETHETQEDSIYYLHSTVLTGDVVTPEEIIVSVKVMNASMTMTPILRKWREQDDMADANPMALIKRVAGVLIRPYAEVLQETTLIGSAEDIDNFLRYLIYIAPQTDFTGFATVQFSVLSGVLLNYEVETCDKIIVIRYADVFNDYPMVIQSQDLLEDGISCAEGTSGDYGPGGCPLTGFEVYDGDCSQVVDGSCFLRLTLSVSAGGLVLPGVTNMPLAQLPPLDGHHPGLNAAILRLRYAPPEAYPSLELVKLTVQIDRVIVRTVATPTDLQQMGATGVVKIRVTPLNTPPALRWKTGEPFHGSIIRIAGSKPYIMKDLIFESPGLYAQINGGAFKVVVSFQSSKGVWFLGDSSGLYFENKTREGQSRIQFRANTSDLRDKYLCDVRYAWDDDDCASWIEWNVTLDDGRNPPWVQRAMMELPACKGYYMGWEGGTVHMKEDGDAYLAGVNLSSLDEALFLLADLRHPPDIQGDCQVVFWPDDYSPFVSGRECHLDGGANDLAMSLKNMSYRPPPNFYGKLQLSLVLQRVDIADAIANRLALPGIFRLPPTVLLIDVDVEGVNDAPELDVDMTHQTLREDPSEPVFLSAIFVSDLDAGDNVLEFTFEFDLGSEWNSLFMCELQSVELLDPWETALDENGCLTKGAHRIQFRATPEIFNSLQRGPGRLQFMPARDWNGGVVVNVTADDLGSGLGEEQRLVAFRQLYIVVTPAVDKPIMSFVCPQALPFISYGHTCLEVRNCLELSAGVDEGEEDTTMWVNIEASDPGISISIDHAASVRVENEGMPSLRIWGLYRNIKTIMRALIIRPPAHIFALPSDPDSFTYGIVVTVVALGLRFDEPLPEDLGGFPQDDASFSVEFRRVNARPLIFLNVDHFAATQLDVAVPMPGLSIMDPDAGQRDYFEVTLEVNADAVGGAFVFAGLERTFLKLRMSLERLNDELENLQFVFKDNVWTGVTDVKVTVSDMGNRGWTMERYDDMYHRETKPKVLTLRGAAVSFVPEATRRYFSLFSGDFTMEFFVKRVGSLPGVETTSFTTPAPPRLGERDMGEDMLRNWAHEAVPDAERPRFAIAVDGEGRVQVLLHSDAGHEVGGKSNSTLEVGTWRHVAVVVRRMSRIAAPEMRRDTTAGEVVLYLDGHLEVVWELSAEHAFYGPATGSFLVVAGSRQGDAEGLSLSRARLWSRALLPGELGRCEEPARIEPEDEQCDGATAHAKSDAETLAFSFNFQGDLAETGRRAAARPVGAWSFDVDSPPPCSALTGSPHWYAFEHCACYDHTLQRQMGGKAGEQYFWHSPQAVVMEGEGLDAFTHTRVEADRRKALNASTRLAIHRRFVNEPPRIRLLEPRSGVLYVLEDHQGYVSFQVAHKAVEQLVPKSMTCRLHVTHGYVRPLAVAAMVRSGLDSAVERRSIEFRSPLSDLNDFLAQLEYTPDPNFAGADEMTLSVSDGEFAINTSVPIIIQPVSDPLVLVCPPGVDVEEGAQSVLVSSNVSISDKEPLPSDDDYDDEIEVEVSVSSGGLRFMPEALLNSDDRAFLSNLSDIPADLDTAPVPVTPDTDVPSDFRHHLSLPTATPPLKTITTADGPKIPAGPVGSAPTRPSGAFIPALRFNSTLGRLRAILRALTYTPYPALFNGLVHFYLQVTATSTGEVAMCDFAIIVHPVNSPPRIVVDQARLAAISRDRAGGRGIRSHEDISLSGLLLLSDPDEEDFDDWFQARIHTSRLTLEVSCGSLSFGLPGEGDYILGVQNGSVAGIEGITFYTGDGSKDPKMDISSTLNHLNVQLHRLYYHSGGSCRGQEVTLSAELDDLGNYGAGGPLRVKETASWNITGP